MLLKDRLLRWLPAILWSLVIFVFSSLAGADFSKSHESNFLIRKVLHIVEYSILCLAFYRGCKKPWLSILLTVLFAVSDEYHQTLIPGRTGKVSDILIDSFAAGLTGFVLWKYFQNLPEKLKTWLLE